MPLATQGFHSPFRHLQQPTRSAFSNSAGLEPTPHHDTRPLPPTIMAFLPQPTLPPPPPRSSQISTSVRAAADGVISVSRRRRVYEFLSAAGATQPTRSVDTPTAPAPTTHPSNGVTPESADPEQVRLQLIARMQQREAAIKADSAEKAALWDAQLAELRKPPPVELPDTAPEPVEPVEQQPVVSYYPSRSVQTAKFFGASDAVPETKPSSAYAATVGYSVPMPPSSVPEDLPSSADTATPVSEDLPSTADTGAPPASSVPELYAPPRTEEEEEEMSAFERIREMVEDVVEDVVEAVEDAKEAVEDVVEDVIEAFTLDEEKPAEKDEQPVSVQEPEPETETVSEPEPEEEPESEPEPEAKQDRSIGEVILDAIVEGVPTPEPAPEEEKPAVDKSDLISLIDSGKIKNLTVTKLRRLLSQNGLKTSGRKAELIARLTSFAKAK